METKNLISIEQICTHHSIEVSFIHSLQETGLIGVVSVDDAFFIEQEQLRQLEMYIEFYYSLDINLEGLETVSHLLQHIDTLQKEVKLLRNKLQFYESKP